MHHSESHASSARKKLLEYEENIKKQQSQSGYLGRTLSREHGKLMESILREGLEKQETERAFRRQYSTRGYNSNITNSLSKTPSSGKKLFDTEQFSLDNTKFKPLKTSRSNRYQEIRIENNDENLPALDQQGNNDSQLVPQYYNDTDEIRSARQNQLMEVKKIKFHFSLLGYIFEVLIGYGAFIGILYLIKAGNFPYFQVLLIIALTMTIHPWRVSNLLLPLTAIPITIVNHYTGLSSLTYIQVLICYLGTMTFNERYKVKLIFIVVLVIQTIFGIYVFPNLLQVFKARKQIYFYLFPLFMFILRNLVQLGYWIVGYSEILYLQIPLFLTGLQYGTILSIPVGEIQFWYLIVFFSLQIMNERTHFMLKVMVNMITFCMPQLKQTVTPSSAKRNNHILSAHWNGFSSINSFHLVACVYALTKLPLSSSPFSSSFSLQFYIQESQWYKPLIVWSLISVYEIMCILLENKKQNIMLIGHTDNRWFMVILRGLTLVLGLWMFYFGLGIGAYSLSRLI